VAKRNDNLSDKQVDGSIVQQNILTFCSRNSTNFSANCGEASCQLVEPTIVVSQSNQQLAQTYIAIFSIEILYLRKYQIQSQNMHFSKFSWGACPQTSLA